MKDAAKQFFRLLILIVIPCGFLWASVGGSISGTIKDTSEAVIGGAVVTATNENTGVQQTVKTEASGSYAFPILPVGHYDVEINHPGFKSYRRRGVIIDA